MTRSVAGPIYVDCLGGKKLFLDFWKLPFVTDEGAPCDVSIVTGQGLGTDLRNALVMLPYEGEPQLHILDDGTHIYARVRPITEHPKNLRVVQRVADADGRHVSMILEDVERRIIFLPFFVDEVIENFQWEKYICGRRTLLPGPVSSAYYALKFLLPGSLKAAGRSRLARLQKRASFPAWPIETSLDDFQRSILRLLLSVSKRPQIPFVWFWPSDRQYCVLLTHDVERHLNGSPGIANLSNVEKRLGFKSSFNVVPFRYAIDLDRLQSLRDDGFEVGVHGYSHDGRLFTSWELFKERAPRINKVAREWEAAGFRSASTYRNPYWLNMIDVDYDSSFFDTDPYEPQPGGCLSLFPFFIGDTVEIPLTMPQDYTLFVMLKEKDIRVWLAKAEQLRRRNGLVCLVAHPDEGYIGDADKVTHYVEFLEALSKHTHMWNPLPRDVARWWRQRHGARLTVAEDEVRVEDGTPEMSIKWARLEKGELILSDEPAAKEES